MNLLKKNKYSIRKYKVGIFSTLIGTVLLLSNPNGAQALTTDHNVQVVQIKHYLATHKIQMPILIET